MTCGMSEPNDGFFKMRWQRIVFFHFFLRLLFLTEVVLHF